MKRTIPPVFICALIISLSATVFPQSSTGDAPTNAWDSLISSMHKMHTAVSSVNESDSTDVDFVHLMLPHHQAAIDMAKTQLLYGKDPQMRRLAQEIITDQQSEIDLMRLWLKQQNAVPQSTLKESKRNQK